MGQKKWRIFISSSHGSEEDTRARDTLALDMETRWGVEPVLYSRPDFSSGYGVSILQNCYHALNSCDFVILILNHIYGSPAENTAYSYTENEYRYAVEHGIPVLKLVGQEVLRDAITYGNLSSDDERTAFLAEKAGCYDDPARVFSFVLSIKNQDRDSTMFPYPDEQPEVITDIARTRIADYGLHVFGERLLSEQITRLENRLASDIFSLSGTPTFLDTRYSVYPATGKEESALSDIVGLMADRESHRLLIAGEAGCGKSTLLQNAYLRAARSFRDAWRESSIPLPIPVYLSLTGRGGTYDFSKNGLADLWREVFPERVFPVFLSLDNLSFDYYIDALDEACDGIAAEQVKTIVEGLVKAPNAHSMVLSTRKHLVKDLELYGLVGRFSHRFEIYGWDDENIRDYIRHHTDPDDAARILLAIHGIQSHRGDSGYFAPLLIKLVLWNIQREGVDAFFDRTNGCARFTIGLLLRYTVEALCRQELSKRELLSDDAVHAHLQVLFDFCWHLHCTSDKRIRGKELLEEIRCAAGIADPTPFIRHFYDLSREFRPTSIHLQFEEYFLAEKALALLGSRESTGELYKNSFFLSSEANRMIADLISVESSDKKAALLDNLFRQYRATKNHSQRIMILYLMPRLVMMEKTILPRLTAFMKKELHKHLKRKNHLEVIVILNCLTQLEDFEAEQLYYHLIREDTEFNLLNRGVYLIYHQDIHAEFGYRDTENADWFRTADRFREHYGSPEKRQKFLRAVDMEIIRSFIESRQKVPEDILAVYGSISEEDLMNQTLHAPILTKTGVQTTYLRYLLDSRRLTPEEAEVFHTDLVTSFRDLQNTIRTCCENQQETRQVVCNN